MIGNQRNVISLIFLPFRQVKRGEILKGFDKISHPINRIRNDSALSFMSFRDVSAFSAMALRATCTRNPE
jgi:hypothetical protein